MLRVLREIGNALHRGRAGADYRNLLVAKLGEIPGRIAASIVVVPAAGMEGVAFVSVDSRDTWKLGPIERPVRHHDEPRAHRIVAIGCDNPSALVFVPADFLDLSLEAHVAIEIEFLCDSARVLEDLRRVGVLFLGDITGLFEQRQIDVRLDIALRARIAIPVPGAAEVAALLDHADTLNARLAQSGARHQAAEAAADDDHLDFVVQRFAREPRLDVRIVDITFEVAFHFDELLIAVDAEPLVALGAILFAQLTGIEIEPTIAAGI